MPRINRARTVRFSLKEHLPKYSRWFFDALRHPVLIYIALAGNAVTFLCAAIFYGFEYGVNPAVAHYFDALWWAFCTVSTVGFGDVTPLTVGGRLTGMLLISTGVVLFVGFTALLVSILFVNVADEMVQEENQLHHEIQRLVKMVEEIRLRIGVEQSDKER